MAAPWRSPACSSARPAPARIFFLLRRALRCSSHGRRARPLLLPASHVELPPVLPAPCRSPPMARPSPWFFSACASGPSAHRAPCSSLLPVRALHLPPRPWLPAGVPVVVAADWNCFPSVQCSYRASCELFPEKKRKSPLSSSSSAVGSASSSLRPRLLLHSMVGHRVCSSSPRSGPASSTRLGCASRVLRKNFRLAVRTSP
jgi:hypothetical protein